MGGVFDQVPLPVLQVPITCTCVQSVYIYILSNLICNTFLEQVTYKSMLNIINILP
jgi:hypothetical protein